MEDGAVIGGTASFNSGFWPSAPAPDQWRHMRASGENCGTSLAGVSRTTPHLHLRELDPALVDDWVSLLREQVTAGLVKEAPAFTGWSCESNKNPALGGESLMVISARY